MSGYNKTLSWLRLFRTNRVGSKTFYKLIDNYGDAESALKALPELSKRGGAKKPLELYDEGKAKAELDKLNEMGGRVVLSDDKVYPEYLRHIADNPPLLCTLGNVDLFSKRSFSMVGSRSSSINGKKIAEDFAKQIGKAGYVVTSGMARGVDTAAHIASMRTGTIAVIAGGIDYIYPKENTTLYDELKERGLIVAEMPMGMMPKPEHFPRRNRIISGISLGTLVVEATERSGSLITARLAGEQGRDVYAIPGSPLDPRSSGPNKLIKEGAKLVTHPKEIIEELLGASSRVMNNIQLMKDSQTELDFAFMDNSKVLDSELSNARNLVEQAIGGAPVGVEEIILETGSSAQVIQSVLMEMELAGRVIIHAGDKVSLAA